MMTCFGIRVAILGNEKRLKKIGACKTAREKREQIEKYIVAENQRQHYNLTADEIRCLTAEILEEV